MSIEKLKNVFILLGGGLIRLVAILHFLFSVWYIITIYTIIKIAHNHLR